MKIALFITVVLLILNAYKVITVESNDFVIRLGLKLSFSFFAVLMFHLIYKLKKQKIKTREEL